MNVSHSIRQVHRWLSVVFTLAVVAASIALAQKEPVVWVSCVPLFPLALLWCTGMVLFAQPVVSRWRSRRRAA